MLQWVRDGSLAGVSRLSPPASPTQCQELASRSEETRCPVPPAIVFAGGDPLQHAPLPGA